MNDRPAPRLNKWPFLIADLALVGVAIWLVTHYPHPLAPWAGALVAACVALAALLAVWPFRLEYETEVKLLESDRLTDAAEAIRNLDDVGGQIRQATSQWQGVQEHAGRTTQAAKEIADRITTEARAFSEFMTKANDAEKATLRLETEKLKRNEGQWLQVLVHTLDHVHALYQAGSRSGQPNLAAQLATFQAACRDLARRVGLTAIDAEVDQDFDDTQLEPVPGQDVPPGPAKVAQVVAAGYAFQGQLLRRPIVALKPASTEQAAEPEPEPEPQPIESEGPLSETPAETTTDASIGEPTYQSLDAIAAALGADHVLGVQPETETPAPAGDELLSDPAGALETGAPDTTELSDPTTTDGRSGAGTESAFGRGGAEEFRLESDPVEALKRRRAGGL